MKLLDKIVVATDLSPDGNDVIRTAASLAHVFDSQLRLLHVVPDMDEDTLVHDVVLNQVTETLVKIKTQLEADRVATETVVLSGVPFDQIIKHADNEDANVIMVGAGRNATGDVRRLGVVTERLLRKANKPIWVVTPGTDQRVTRIVCPVDFSTPSKRALANAIHLARRFRADLTVLHVMQSLARSASFHAAGRHGDRDAESAYREKQEHTLDRFLRTYDFHNVRWKSVLREGAPHEEILSVVEETRSDLLVMGTVGRTALARILMGSVTAKVVREVPCSFVTVKAEHAIRVRLETDAMDLKSHFDEGRDLLENGLPLEARRKFEYCLAKNPMYAPAWDQLAIIHERLGDARQAARCEKETQLLLKTLWNQRVQADVRRRHPLFARK